MAQIYARLLQRNTMEAGSSDKVQPETPTVGSIEIQTKGN
jgi:hypothetical protein